MDHLFSEKFHEYADTFTVSPWYLAVGAVPLSLVWLWRRLQSQVSSLALARPLLPLMTDTVLIAARPDLWWNLLFLAEPFAHQVDGHGPTSVLDLV
jgi:hypothetical protein